MLLALALAFLGALAGFLIAAAMHHAILHGAKPNVIDALVAQLGLEIPLVATLLYGLPRITGFTLRQLGYASPRAKEIGIACVGTLAAIVIVSIVSQVLETTFHLKHEQAIIQQFVQLRDPWRIAFFAVFAIAIGPIAEETIFRVFLFNVGLRYGGFWVGAIARPRLRASASSLPAFTTPLVTRTRRCSPTHCSTPSQSSGCCSPRISSRVSSISLGVGVRSRKGTMVCPSPDGNEVLPMRWS